MSSEDDDQFGDFLITLLAVVIVLGGMMLYNQCVYDDWTCAFKECVVVKGEIAK